MFTRHSGGEHARGQIIVLAGLVMSLVIFAVGLVIDGGMGLAQRREAQNASDFGALAGARIVAQYVAGDMVNGTDAMVQEAITNAVVANDGLPPSFGAPDGPRYINDAGDRLGYVGDGIPVDAAGVKVTSGRTWEPFFLGFFGFDELNSSAEATAKGGYSLAGPPGPVFPAGIATAFFDAHPIPCGGDISTDPADPCYPQPLTPGTLNAPGGFGWLKFGCNGYGLGQDETISGECSNAKPFLQLEIGPPGKSYGCCTQVGLPGSPDRIGSLPGEKASADCSFYVENETVVTVPIWDLSGGTGDGAWYQIVGFAGFQITACPGAKNLEGVWRLPIWGGPVSSTPTGDPAYQALGVQLVK